MRGRKTLILFLTVNAALCTGRQTFAEQDAVFQNSAVLSSVLSRQFDHFRISPNSALSQKGRGELLPFPLMIQETKKDFPVPPGDVLDRKPSGQEKFENARNKPPSYGKLPEQAKEKPINLTELVKSHVYTGAILGGSGGFIAGGLISAGIFSLSRAFFRRSLRGPVLISLGVIGFCTCVGANQGADIGWKIAMSKIVKEALDP